MEEFRNSRSLTVLPAEHQGESDSRTNNEPPGSDLFSHTVTSAVSSALKRFTSVFGMGTGGATSLGPPGGRIAQQYIEVSVPQSTIPQVLNR